MEPERDPEGYEIEQLASLRLKTNDRVLEVGAGDGRLTWRYAAGVQSVAGIDPDLEALRDARTATPTSLVGRVHVAQAMAERLPFRSESFDIVILAWSL